MRKVVHLVSVLLICAGLAGLSAGVGSGCEKRAPSRGQGDGGSPTRAPAGGAGAGLTQSIKYEVVASTSPDQLGKLEVLSGVHDFPTRVKCATLAWHTLRAALEKRTDTVTTE